MNLAKEILKMQILEEDKIIQTMSRIMKGIREESKKFFSDLDSSIGKLKMKSVRNVRDSIRKNKEHWEKVYNHEYTAQKISSSMRQQLRILKLPQLNTLNRGKMSTPKSSTSNAQTFKKKSNGNGHENGNVMPSPPQYTNVIENEVPTFSPPPVQTFNPPPAQPRMPTPPPNPDFNQTELITRLPMDKISIYYRECFRKVSLNLSNEQVQYFAQNVMENISAKLKTVYKMSSKKEYSVAKFNEKLKGVSPVLVVCEAANGHVFGAFSNTPFDSASREYGSNFIFSLRELKRHDVRDYINDSTVNSVDRSKFGPFFGNKDLLIGDDCGKTESCQSFFGDEYQYAGSDPESYLGGKEFFSLNNLVVFKVKRANK